MAVNTASSFKAMRFVVKMETLRLPFPSKIYQLLQDADEYGFCHVVSWNAGGTGFKVHDVSTFTRLVIPRYFNQTKYKSFQRQLCLYGFERVSSGSDKGLRCNKLFVRGARHLCREIKYVGVQSSKNVASCSDNSINEEVVSTTKATGFQVGIKSHFTTGGSCVPGGLATTDVNTMASPRLSTSIERTSAVNIMSARVIPTLAFIPQLPPARRRPMWRLGGDSAKSVVSAETIPDPNTPNLLPEIQTSKTSRDAIDFFEGKPFHVLENAAESIVPHEIMNVLSPKRGVMVRETVSQSERDGSSSSPFAPAPVVNSEDLEECTKGIIRLPCNQDQRKDFQTAFSVPTTTESLLFDLMPHDDLLGRLSMRRRIQPGEDNRRYANDKLPY